MLTYISGEGMTIEESTYLNEIWPVIIYMENYSGLIGYKKCSFQVIQCRRELIPCRRGLIQCKERNKSDILIGQ